MGLERHLSQNLLKYGFNAGQLRFWLAHPMRAVPLLLTWVGLSWFALVALGVERAGAKGLLKNHHVLWIHTLNTIGAVLVPCIIIVYWHPDLLVSLLFMLVVLTLGMKLVSYAHVNHDLRVRPSPRSLPLLLSVPTTRIRVALTRRPS